MYNFLICGEIRSDNGISMTTQCRRGKSFNGIKLHTRAVRSFPVVTRNRESPLQLTDVTLCNDHYTFDTLRMVRILALWLHRMLVYAISVTVFLVRRQRIVRLERMQDMSVQP